LTLNSYQKYKWLIQKNYELQKGEYSTNRYPKYLIKNIYIVSFFLLFCFVFCGVANMKLLLLNYFVCCSC